MSESKTVLITGSSSGFGLLTARTLEDDLVRGFETGADDYLTKPYRLAELLVLQLLVLLLPEVQNQLQAVLFSVWLQHQ